jgi:hypothetical protein
MYAKVLNNELIHYPSNPRTDHTNVSFPINWSGGEINGDNYIVVSATTPPVINLGWTYTELTPEIIDGIWTQTWSTQLKSNDEIKSEVSSKRYEIEVGGVRISNNVYSTDRESQTKYVAVAVDISHHSLKYQLLMVQNRMINYLRIDFYQTNH